MTATLASETLTTATPAVRRSPALAQQTAAPSNHTALASPWKLLPPDLQTLIAQSAFDKLSKSEQQIVLRVRAAVTNVGLWSSVASIVGVDLKWHQLNVMVKPDLLGRLPQHGFSRDTAILNIKHPDMNSFRQLGRLGREGLHISISKSGSGYATIHLDEWDPIAGQNEYGESRPHLGDLIQHGIIDNSHVAPKNRPSAPDPGSLPWDTENVQRRGFD